MCALTAPSCKACWISPTILTRQARFHIRAVWWRSTGMIPIWSWRRTREPRPFPTSPMRWPSPMISGWAMLSHQAGPQAMTTRPWPLRRGAPGRRSSDTFASWARISSPSPSPVSGSATCPAMCLAMACCCRGRRGSWRHLITAIFSLTQIQTLRPLGPSVSGCSTCRVRLGPTMPLVGSPQGGLFIRATPSH